MTRRPPRSTLFPYTTLFRSQPTWPQTMSFGHSLMASLAVVAGPVVALIAFSLIYPVDRDRKSTRLNSSHGYISYAVFCLKKKKKYINKTIITTYKYQQYTH